jgi:hypothetical protein
MTALAALPFLLTRSQEEIVGREITSTREKVHGLLRLDGNRLLIQWRVARKRDRVGASVIRTERELDPVREIPLPLRSIAGVGVRWRWWEWPPGPRLLLVAADLHAFEDIAGETGLRLDHPAELAFRLRPHDRLAAREFAGELAMALADQAMRTAEQLDVAEAERALPPSEHASRPTARVSVPPERARRPAGPANLPPEAR